MFHQFNVVLAIFDALIWCLYFRKKSTNCCPFERIRNAQAISVFVHFRAFHLLFCVSWFGLLVYSRLYVISSDSTLRACAVGMTHSWFVTFLHALGTTPSHSVWWRTWFWYFCCSCKPVDSSRRPRKDKLTWLATVFFLRRFRVSEWHPKIWKLRYGFALYWRKTIWGKRVFLHVAIATDGCNVKGRQNFLTQE